MRVGVLIGQSQVIQEIIRMDDATISDVARAKAKNVLKWSKFMRKYGCCPQCGESLVVGGIDCRRCIPCKRTWIKIDKVWHEKR